MSIQYGIIGAFTIDNIINAEGEVGAFQCGGNAYYATAGARLWSNELGVVARVGEDYPRKWVTKLADAGVDVSGVKEIDGPHLLHSGMKYDSQGKREDFSPRNYFGRRGQPVPKGMLPDFPSGDPNKAHQGQLALAPDPGDVPRSYLGAKAFHLAPRYYAKHQASLSLIKKYRILAVLDPGIWYMDARSQAKAAALFKNVDILIPSELEVRSLFGAQISLPKIAKTLALYGPLVVVIKVGQYGSIVYDRQKDLIQHIPAYPVDVVDPTGAGDSFCGGFMVGFLETKDAFMAAMYATVSASFVVEGFGADYAFRFSGDQARSRLEKLIKLAKYNS